MRQEIRRFDDHSIAYEPDPEAGFYKEFEKECSECGQKFSTSIPASWFNGNGELDKDKIINGRTVEQVQQSIEDTICQACKQKDEIAAAGRQMNENR